VTWSFTVAWAAAKIAGILYAAALIATPALRSWAEARANRRRRE
jgi:hypothetical protein